MEDFRAQILSERLMAGNRITPIAVMRWCGCSKPEAIELLEQATIKMEEQLNDREIRKQAEIDIAHKKQRYANRSVGFRSRRF